MNSTAAAQPAPKTDDKHTFLHREIENIDAVIDRLNELQERISGPFPQEEKAKELCESLPTLAEMLNGGPNLISEKLQRIHHQINAINEILF